jgi:hypothetical protein
MKRLVREGAGTSRPAVVPLQHSYIHTTENKSETDELASKKPTVATGNRWRERWEPMEGGGGRRKKSGGMNKRGDAEQFVAGGWASKRPP